jgi:hypothetical protein
LPLCAKSWPTIQIHLLSLTFSVPLTKTFPAEAARLQAALHQSPAKSQSLAHHQNLANLRNNKGNPAA